MAETRHMKHDHCPRHLPDCGSKHTKDQGLLQEVLGRALCSLLVSSVGSRCRSWHHKCMAWCCVLRSKVQVADDPCW